MMPNQHDDEDDNIAVELDEFRDECGREPYGADEFMRWRKDRLTSAARAQGASLLRSLMSDDQESEATNQIPDDAA